MASESTRLLLMNANGTILPWNQQDPNNVYEFFNEFPDYLEGFPNETKMEIQQIMAKATGNHVPDDASSSNTSYTEESTYSSTFSDSGYSSVQSTTTEVATDSSSSDTLKTMPKKKESSWNNLYYVIIVLSIAVVVLTGVLIKKIRNTRK